MGISQEEAVNFLNTWRQAGDRYLRALRLFEMGWMKEGYRMQEMAIEKEDVACLAYSDYASQAGVDGVLTDGQMDGKRGDVT